MFLKIIATSPHFSQQWHNEILFFTKNWLIDQENDPSWIAFHRYLLAHAWKQAQFAISKIELSLNWELFARAISFRRLKTTPYLSDQVKHLMLISGGKWPGFIAADHSQQIAPILGLQRAIVDTYQLKQYLPSVMHISLLNAETSRPVYYSLVFPTLLEGAPENKNSSTIMLALKDIKLLLQILKETSIANKKFSNEMLKYVHFDCFHVEPDKENEINPSKKIIESDKSFLNDSDHFPNRAFCSTSHFWRGCIKIGFDK